MTIARFNFATQIGGPRPVGNHPPKVTSLPPLKKANAGKPLITARLPVELGRVAATADSASQFTSGQTRTVHDSKAKLKPILFA